MTTSGVLGYYDRYNNINLCNRGIHGWLYVRVASTEKSIEMNTNTNNFSGIDWTNQRPRVYYCWTHCCHRSHHHYSIETEQEQEKIYFLIIQNPFLTNIITIIVSHEM
jgi:hypothetical protein